MEKRDRKPRGYWDNKENCRKAVSNCKTRKEFCKKYSRAYHASREKGWLDDICSHMEEIIKPYGYWNDKENCRKAASNCKIRSEFGRKYSRAYVKSRDNGWLDEFFPKNK